MADNPDRIAELEEKLRVLTIQNNARGVLLAGYDAQGLDRRAEHLARQQLDSQREANARLTDEVEALQGRLAAAEAARDAALRELETERLLHQVSCDGRKRDVRGLEDAIEAETEERRAAERERDAALARAERLEEAHRTAELLIHSLLGKDDGWETQAAKLLAWSTASAALSPAAEEA